MKTQKEDKIKKKIVEIIADYKFNSTQISIAEQIAERIIGIAKLQEQEKFEKLIDEWLNHIEDFNTCDGKVLGFNEKDMVRRKFIATRLDNWKQYRKELKSKLKNKQGGN